MQVTYRSLFEGIVRFNIIFFIVALCMFYVKTMDVATYYHLLSTQFLVIILTVMFAKFYDTLRNHNKFKESKITNKAIYIGFIDTLIVMYICGLIFGYFSWNIKSLHTIFNELIFGILFWMIILYLAKLQLFDRIIKFLTNAFTYVQIFYIFAMLNLIFFAITIVFFTIAPGSGRSFFETIFIILYFQAAFFVFHIAVGRIIDIFWLPDKANYNKVSLLGIFLGAIIFVTKIAIIDQEILNIVYTHGIKAPMIAALSIMAFWSFFYFLFHIEVQYPLKHKQIFSKRKKKK